MGQVETISSFLFDRKCFEEFWDFFDRMYDTLVWFSFGLCEMIIDGETEFDDKYSENTKSW